MTRVTQSAEVEALTVFGAALAVSSAFTNSAAEVASASSSTSITATGAASHATNDAVGAMLVANTVAAWTGTTLYGVVQSNTSGTTPVYTVDRWYTLNGAISASTPSTTSPILVLPTSAPFWYVANSDSTASVSAGDKGSALGGSELTSSGLARQKITTVTRTAGGSGTMSLSTVFTATGSGTIGRSAIVNSLVASKDFGYFLDQVNSGVAVSVLNGDTYTPTWVVSIA